MDLKNERMILNKIYQTNLFNYTQINDNYLILLENFNLMKINSLINEK
jgi:hypothetical protein